MYFFQDLNFQKYMELKVQREFLKTKIAELQLELSQSELVFNMLDSIYNPKVSIQEVKNPVMGHRFIGKVRVLGRYLVIGVAVKSFPEFWSCKRIITVNVRVVHKNFGIPANYDQFFIRICLFKTFGYCGKHDALAKPTRQVYYYSFAHFIICLILVDMLLRPLLEF